MLYGVRIEETYIAHGKCAKAHAYAGAAFCFPIATHLFLILAPFTGEVPEQSVGGGGSHTI